MQSANADVASTSVQSERWASIVPHIFRTPFLRNKLISAGFSIADIADVSVVSSLPFTTKDELRQTPAGDRSPLSIEELEFVFTSSGTTGPPTSYYWSADDSAVLRQAGRRAMQRIGVHADDLALTLAPMGLPIMWYCMVNQFLASGAGVVPLGVQSPDEIVRALRDYPTTIFITLPLVATRLFEYIVQAGASPNDLHLPLRQVQTGGHFLSAARRARIEAMWGVDCFDMYGLSEVFGPIAGECTEKNGLHICDDLVMLEVIDPDTHQPVPTGKIGVAVYTTLWQKGTPLLRYWSDDYVRVTADACACGDPTPRVFYLGRPDDFVTIDGRRIFACDIENIVLGCPATGSEFTLTIGNVCGSISAELEVETIAEFDSAKALLIQALGEILRIPVEVNSVSPGTLPRDQPKARRIVDLRIGEPPC